MAFEFIASQECLGDSLAKINNNANSFDQRIIALTNTIATLSTALLAADAALTVAVSAAAPVGAVQTFAMVTAPVGWLECNGVIVPNGVGTVQGKTANFSALHAAVGSTYGSAGRLPDLRGEFVRGWDGGFSGSRSPAVDSGRTFGSNQSHQFASHSHGITDPGHNHTVSSRDDFNQSGGGTLSNNNSAPDQNTPTSSRTTGITINSAGGAIAPDETRPRNVALLYCIKY